MLKLNKQELSEYKMMFWINNNNKIINKLVLDDLLNDVLNGNKCSNKYVL